MTGPEFWLLVAGGFVLGVCVTAGTACRYRQRAKYWHWVHNNLVDEVEEMQSKLDAVKDDRDRLACFTSQLWRGSWVRDAYREIVSLPEVDR